MKNQALLGALVILLSVSVRAQQADPTIVAEGGDPDDRASSRVLYWNTKVDAAAGQFAINYGRPMWKKAYEDQAKFDEMTKGKVWRMGSNFWTNLDTCLPLKISGRGIAVGSYYLGLHRSADGSRWSLAFIDPTKVRRARLDAFQIEKALIEFEAPMSTEKATGTVEKLTITLSYPKDNPKNVRMKVTWGNLALAAPIEVMVHQ
jgi:hypothetical protein